MKPFVLIFLLLCMPKNSLAQELRDFRWKNRLLLLCENGENLEQSQKQMDLFKDFAQEMEDRKLLLLFSSDGQLLDVNRNLLTKNTALPLSLGFTGVILIGLDGTVKWESGFYADPSEVFRVIDSMPMRRAEIKNKYQP
ncbi:hypothetical protein GCM10011361_09450 [Muriicola marianensis]|uniref:DUF4174 domain-containing protein n=2 Tax=Muriicola marianensis TaxID=1324801 RepID=A0ABQ1QV73_9FLAO|nr:hypothetical protein GCM10011361_09450 [Muriicola marianensis]